MSGLSLLDSAEWLGRCAWAESQAFEILGRWSVDESTPSARVLFAAHSAHHGWRCNLARDRLPQLADKSPADFVDPSSPAVAEVFDDLSRQSATGYRLVAAYEVMLPELTNAYARYAGALSPVTDATTVRLLRILATDAEADRVEGQQLLRSIVSAPDDLAKADAFQERVAQALAAAGGILGFDKAHRLQ